MISLNPKTAVIIDSNVFIALWHSKDTHAQDARSILTKVAEGEIQHVYLTNYALMEVINFLLRKISFEAASSALTYLTQTERIKIIYVDSLSEVEHTKLFTQYKILSLTDCSLVNLASELGIKIIYSFDTGFDSIKAIERKER